MDTGPRAAIHFPIEGRSPWVQVLRVTALGSVGAIIAVAAMMIAFQPSGENSPLLLCGLAAFLLLEYLVIRAVIVPRLADYGRFRVYHNKVDFYPLGVTGLRVSPASDSEPITAFAGLTVRAEPEKGRYKVLLLHKERGRTICLKTYNAPEPANSHAEALAHSLDLRFRPSAA